MKKEKKEDKLYEKVCPNCKKKFQSYSEKQLKFNFISHFNACFNKSFEEAKKEKKGEKK